MSNVPRFVSAISEAGGLASGGRHGVLISTGVPQAVQNLFPSLTSCQHAIQIINIASLHTACIVDFLIALPLGLSEIL